MRILHEADVRRSLSMKKALEVIERAARSLGEGHARSVPRQRVDGAERLMHVLPAASDELGTLGLKAYVSGGERTDFWFLLFDQGGLRALIEADTLGRLRTGAAGGVAVQALSKPDASRLGVIGTGGQAYTQVEAIVAVRPITHIDIYSRSAARRAAFIAELETRLGLEAVAVDNARDAVAFADIVVTATPSREPVFEGAWLQPGTHVNAIGSNRATHREIDDATLARARTIAVEDIAQAQSEAGDLLHARDFSWARVCTLSDVLLNTPRVAESANARGDITIFESLGIGLWDLAVATAAVVDAEKEHTNSTLHPPERYASLAQPYFSEDRV